MLGVSLRTIAIGLSVAYALLVASITLGSTVTVTTDSLRRFGKQHANALADVTLTRLEAFFELPSVHIDMMKNASRLYVTTSTVSILQQRLWLDRTNFDMFSVPQSRGTNVIFMDGTRIFSSVLVFPTDVHEDRYADGIEIQIESYGQPGNFSSLWTYDSLFYDDSLTLFPPTSHWWRLHQYKIDTAVILKTLMSGTFGGRLTIWYSQPLLVVLSHTILYTTLISPLYDTQKTLIGFCGPAITLNIMSTYLQQIQETPHSFGFIIDGLGFLLATSCPIPFTNLTITTEGLVPPLGCQSSGADFLVNTNGASNATQYKSCRTAAVDYAYAPLRAVMSDATLATATTQTAAYMVVDGDGYFVVSSPITMRYPNLVLQLVITVPEVEVVGDLVGPRNVAIGVSVGVAAALSIGIAALVSFLFAPIGRTAKRLQDDDPLAGDEQASFSFSSLTEVRDIQLAHRAMRGELRRIRAFVPQQAINSLEEATPDFVSLPQLFYSQSNVPSPNPFVIASQTPAADEDLGSMRPTTCAAAASSAAPKQNRRVRRKVRFVDEDGASIIRYNVIEVPLLDVRDVAVLSANVNGFRHWCSQLPGALCRDTAAALTLGVRALVRDAHDAIQRHGGVLDRFNGDQVEATFAAHGGCGDASYTRAVLAGIDLVENRRSDAAATAAAMDDGLDGAAPLRWRVGVGFGSSIVGHAGSDAAQSSHIIGAAWTHAVACQELSKVYRVRGVAVSERVFALMQGEVGLEWRALGVEHLPGQTRKSVVLAVRRRATSMEDLNERAVALRNAVHFLRSEGQVAKAATIGEAFRAHLNGRHAEWERLEYLRWTDVPSLRLVDGSILSEEEWAYVLSKLRSGSWIDSQV